VNEKKDSSVTNDNVAQVLETTDYHEDVDFCNVDFGPTPLTNQTFESCIFSSCRFRETPMTGAAFRSSVFRSCELVVVKMSGVVLDRTLFESSKIMGINFSDADNLGFSPDFRKSVISNSVFGGLSFRKGAILECRLVDCDLSDCDFREAEFSATTFEHVAISNCNFEKADFRSARGYAIDPLTNRVRKARFSLPEALSFLSFLGIQIDD
jgi:uncharacterized protein YjbI with pentapeptide repeats